MWRVKRFFKKAWKILYEIGYTIFCLVMICILLTIGTIITKRRPRIISILGDKKVIMNLYGFSKKYFLLVFDYSGDMNDYEYTGGKAAQDAYDKLWEQHREEQLIVKLAKLT